MEIAHKIAADRYHGIILVMQLDCEMSIRQTLVFRDRIDCNQMSTVNADKLPRIQTLFQIHQRSSNDELSIRSVNRRVLVFTLEAENIFNRNDHGTVADLCLNTTQVRLLHVRSAVEKTLHSRFWVHFTRKDLSQTANLVHANF